MSNPVPLSLFEADAPPARPIFGNKETYPLAAKRRYATYLRPDQISTIERLSLETQQARGRKVYDYEIVQAAIDQYAARFAS